MINNKKGALNPKTVLLALGAILGIILLFVLISYIGVWVGSGNANAAEVDNFVKFGDAVNVPGLNFITYIAGGIPQFLINQVGEVSAVIVIFVIFLMLLFTFSDILSSFSLFSQSISWVVGVGMAIIAANLKLVMYISVWSFGFIGGVGAISVAFGILIPFIIFFSANWLLVKGVKPAFSKKYDSDSTAEGFQRAADFLTGARTATEAARGK